MCVCVCWGGGPKSAEGRIGIRAGEFSQRVFSRGLGFLAFLLGQYFFWKSSWTSWVSWELPLWPAPYLAWRRVRLFGSLPSAWSGTVLGSLLVASPDPFCPWCCRFSWFWKRGYSSCPRAVCRTKAPFVCFWVWTCSSSWRSRRADSVTQLTVWRKSHRFFERGPSASWRIIFEKTAWRFPCWIGAYLLRMVSCAREFRSWSSIWSSWRIFRLAARWKNGTGLTCCLSTNACYFERMRCAPGLIIKSIWCWF